MTAIWVAATVTLFALSGLGVALCSQIMLQEVQRRLPEGQKISHPQLSWKYLEIVKLHEQYYPKARVRGMSRLLLFVAIISIASLGASALLVVILRSIPK